MNKWSGEVARDGSEVLSFISMTAIAVAMLVGGIIISLLLEGRFSSIGLYVVGGIIGAASMAIIVFLRQNELATTAVIIIQLYVDWYLGLHIVSQVMVLVLLVLFFLARSPRYPWAEPRALWLWGLFLMLSIFPAIQGATNPYDTAFYYPNIIFGALNVFWLGTVIARDHASVRHLFKLLAGFATLVAVHTIIQATTGISLFAVSRVDTFLAGVSNYQLAGSYAHRIGSFFIDPNWNGTFFAMMLFIPLGLFIESSSFLEKALYLAEVSLMLPALLFTYSNGAWIAAFAGVIVFILFVGHARYRVLIPLFVLIAAMAIIVIFPLQIGLLLQRAAEPSELSLRLADWQTAIRVISTFPLTGIGLGHSSYLERSAPYSVLTPDDHPHNSYLELGAMAGLPVLLTFMALLLFTLWLALRNWKLADARARSLIGAGIAAVITLSINSMGINGWTLPPLAAIGWLILGAITSPLLSRELSCQIMKEKKT